MADRELTERAAPRSAAPAGAAKKVAPAEAKLLPPMAASSVDQLYPETTGRPLWVPTRRPAPAVLAAPASFNRRARIGSSLV